MYTKRWKVQAWLKEDFKFDPEFLDQTLLAAKNRWSDISNPLA